MTARDDIFARIRAALADLPERRAHPEFAPELTYPRSAPTAPGGPADDRTGGASDGLDGSTGATAITALTAIFRAQMQRAGGHVFTDPAELGAWLRAEGATRGVCDPALQPALAAALGPGLRLDTALDRTRIDDHAFGITRASGAIAETGTVILHDADTSSRLAALAPWIHIAVLDPGRIHAHLADAVAALGADPNVVWCTGPSKTADVEGILIQGVHGPGEQVALLWTF
jgi:L-lactate dehydrogenase complex protein LldG